MKIKKWRCIRRRDPHRTKKPQAAVRGLREAQIVLERTSVAFFFLLFLFYTPGLAARQIGDSVLDLGIVEFTRVEIVEAWPFVVKAKKGKDTDLCMQLGSKDVRVLESGQDVYVVSVDEAPPVFTQVLLLDTSASMSDPTRVRTRKKGRQTKTAAKAYVRWMLEDSLDHSGTSGSDPSSTRPRRDFVLFTFDDDLLMRVRPMAVTDPQDVERLDRVIDGITGGQLTTLADSVFHVVRYLSGRGGRAVVILLSDGADAGSMRQYDRVSELLKETNNVVIFSIAIGGAKNAYQKFLAAVAKDTGGKFYWLRSGQPDSLGDRLERVFSEIRNRLKGQLFVSYLAKSYGEVRTDTKQVDGTGNVHRSVRLVSLNSKCEIPEWGYRSIRNVKRQEENSVDPDDPWLAKIDREDLGDRLELRVKDIVRDTDPLIRYSGEPAHRKWERRVVELIVPPFAGGPGGTSAWDRGVEDVLHDWLLQDVLPQRDLAGRNPVTREKYFPVDREINGKTFLEQRDGLAEVLFLGFRQYREWVLGKLSVRIRDRFKSYVKAGGSEELARTEEILDSLVEYKLRHVRPQDYRDDLAAWFGDVPAPVVGLRLEVKEANLLLSGEATARSDADGVQRRWRRVYDWLFYPNRVRVLTPLELSCDSEMDVCGFFRIVLPRLSDLPEDLERLEGKTLTPTTFEQFVTYRQNMIPRHPFGLMTLRWLLGLPVHPDLPPEGISSERQRLGRNLRDGWRVTALTHRPEEVDLSGRDMEVEPSPLYCRRRVRIDLIQHPAGDTGTRARIDVVVEGHVDQRGLDEDEHRYRDVCGEHNGPVRVVPQCYDPVMSRIPSELESLLESCGLPACAMVPPD